MNYYEVLVASQRYHGDKALTYSTTESLGVGQVVVVNLQKQEVLGVVNKGVGKPSFAVKAILKPLDLMVPLQLIELLGWLGTYYPAPLGQILTLILPASLKKESRKKIQPDITVQQTTEQPIMTPEQQQVLKAIGDSHSRMHLLHGETGSGKTRVYIELISETLGVGKSCILLTPEIGLTPQLAASIEETFPGQSVVLHSNLTPVERRNRWRKIAENSKPLVVIGPRSALFAPVHDIGLIIIDEAHDSAYKQEQAPHYQTSRVAAKLGELHGAKVILGSATPLVSDVYTFLQKQLPIHRMLQLATPKTYTSYTKIVSLRDRSNFSKSSWLSTDMLDSIASNLSKGLQSLIFLNRRGSARLVLCQDCGWQAVCPRCDVPLTYHGDNHRMQCHTCGYKASTPASCPVCNSAELVFRSIGTKALTDELQGLFPKARIMRFDGDNPKAERLESQFDAISSGKVDIIVGTQILAKGLDLPKLGLVGIVIADTGLYFPDYTAEEKTYQLITQVMGRADRGHQKTSIFVQTYHPDNRTIKEAFTKDFDSFYNHQIEDRKTFGFPPFRYLLKLSFERSSSRAAENAAAEGVNKIRGLGLKLEISNPAPAFVEKSQNRYRWQIVIKALDRKLLLEVIRNLPNGVSYDIDPVNLL